jgi:hypothetical protein
MSVVNSLEVLSSCFASVWAWTARSQKGSPFAAIVGAAEASAEDEVVGAVVPGATLEALEPGSEEHAETSGRVRPIAATVSRR